jgi:hypothetical protein
MAKTSIDASMWLPVEYGRILFGIILRQDVMKLKKELNLLDVF